ncbi:ROK family protein [Gramella sp. AN32]|uniref:ROK family protein n=1 Tax=Christiangramia antarctica TaxID=2058158 RepID=A0ABW5X2B4_9FLAO|nr:ROK family protein [Gramella sp. AN32]
MTLVNQLTHEGFIKKTKQKRDRHFVLTNQHNLLILTIHLNFDKSYALLFDQLGNVIEEIPLKDCGLDTENLINSLTSIVLKLSDLLNAKFQNILSISFILPMYAEFQGSFPSPSTFQEIEENLEKKLRKNICILNPSYSAQRAFFELKKEKRENALILTIHKEIGLSIVSNGKMADRRHFPGSEFGHSPLSFNDKLCSCGKKNCLENEVSYSAIINKVNKALLDGQNSVLKVGNISIDSILNAAIAGDQLSIKIFHNIGFNLGKAISVLIQLIAPEKIMLISDIYRAKDFLSNGISSGLNLYCPFFKSENVIIEYHDSNYKNLFTGAYYAAWDKTFYNQLKLMN